MAPETRVIEKYGIIKFGPDDVRAKNLILTSAVRQLPKQEYINTKSQPPKGHYGYCTLMYGEYVKAIIDIQFRLQVLFDWEQYITQLAWQEFCNSRTIAYAVESPLPTNPVDYPAFRITEARFKLEPGVILVVRKNLTPIEKCGTNEVDQTEFNPPDPQAPANPPLPPPDGTPPSQQIPLSAPYSGIDDQGKTYVRPRGSAPSGGNCPKLYRIRSSGSWTVQGQPYTSTNVQENVPGPLSGFTVQLSQPAGYDENWESGIGKITYPGGQLNLAGAGPGDKGSVSISVDSIETMDGSPDTC